MVTTAEPVGNTPCSPDEGIGLGLQFRTGSARNDRSHAAAMREVAVRRVHDRVDRLFQEVAANHLEVAFLG